MLLSKERKVPQAEGTARAKVLRQDQAFSINSKDTRELEQKQEVMDG